MSSIDKQARQVSRYDLVSGYMQKWPDGDFVYHSDYQALLDELEAKDRRIEEEIGRANREHHRGFMMACGHMKEHSNVHYSDAAEMEIAALRNRINELEATPPATVSVPDYPDVLPCPVMLEPGLRFGKGVTTKAMLGALQRRSEYYAELDAMTPEQRDEHDAGIREFATMLKSFGNSEQLEPVTTTYKLRVAVETIRNSGIEIDAEKIFAERDALNTPDCWCRTCRPVTISDMRFVVCPDCGNKRCPHANDHRNACTGSNEPGQEGSAYPAAPQQEAKNV